MMTSLLLSFNCITYKKRKPPAATIFLSQKFMLIELHLSANREHGTPSSVMWITVKQQIQMVCVFGYRVDTANTQKK